MARLTLADGGDVVDLAEQLHGPVPPFKWSGRVRTPNRTLFRAPDTRFAVIKLCALKSFRVKHHNREGRVWQRHTLLVISNRPLPDRNPYFPMLRKGVLGAAERCPAAILVGPFRRREALFLPPC